jgi:tetratricopeptide (TPR) repeat protein
LRYQAAAALEKLDSDTERPAPDLGTATLYALALRERRRLLNGWDGSLEVLGSGNPEFWKSTIAILFGLIPNPQDLLAYLLSTDQKIELQQLGIHALVSNPLPLDVQSAHLLELVSNYSLPKFLELLRVISSVNPNLAQQAAAQALEDLHTVEGDDNELAEIQRLLLQAEVHQISGQSSKADTLLHSAWQASRQLEVDLASKLAETNGLDSEAISEIQKSAQSGKVSTKSKRPAALLSAAKVALKSGDAVEAKEMALAALKSAAKENSTDNRKAATLRELSDLLIELNLRDEALLAAQAAADAQPNDADGALLLGKLLQENGKAAEALQQAHLAAALDPQNSEVRRNLANILFSIHLHEDAFQEWKAMLDNEVEPSSADWLAFAEAGLHSGHYDETLKACQYALVLQPTNGAAYALIGSALVAQGDEGSALAHLRRATELAPAQPDAWLALAKLQLATNDPDDAQATLVAAQQFTAPTAKMQQLLGAAYQAMDRLDEALSAYLEAAKLAETEQDMETAPRRWERSKQRSAHSPTMRRSPRNWASCCSHSVTPSER